MIYWSDELAYGRLHPTPSGEELDRYYAATTKAASYLGGRSSDESQRRFSLNRRLLFRIIARADHGRYLTAQDLHERLERKAGRVCEIGCASGVWLERLRDLGHDVFGIEPSAAGRDVSAARGLHVVAGTAEDPPTEFPYGTFDGVLMLQSLEHCVDPVRAVETVFRLLRPGGWFLCDVPNAACARFGQSREAWFPHLDAGRHISFLHRPQPRATGPAHGLVPYLIQLQRLRPSIRVARVRARDLGRPLRQPCRLRAGERRRPAQRARPMDLRSSDAARRAGSAL